MSISKNNLILKKNATLKEYFGVLFLFWKCESGDDFNSRIVTETKKNCLWIFNEISFLEDLGCVDD
jgi:hypothetical protein